MPGDLTSVLHEVMKRGQKTIMFDIVVFRDVAESRYPHFNAMT